MEVDPRLDSNVKYDTSIRLSLLKDILSNYLDLECASSQDTLKYTQAYFLGRHEVILNQNPINLFQTPANLVICLEKTRIPENHRQSSQTREYFGDEKYYFEILWKRSFCDGSN